MNEQQAKGIAALLGIADGLAQFSADSRQELRRLRENNGIGAWPPQDFPPPASRSAALLRELAGWAFDWSPGEGGKGREDFLALASDASALARWIEGRL